MIKNFKKLETFDGESLMDERIESLQFCIDTLLPQGLIILAGPPKVGKSWLVLDWCLSISKGEKVWNYTTKQGTSCFLYDSRSVFIGNVINTRIMGVQTLYRQRKISRTA